MNQSRYCYDNSMNPKIFLLAVVATVIGAFFFFDLQQYLNLEFLKSQQAALNEFTSTKPAQAAAIYFAIYLVVASFALPAAAIITLAGGAIFGFWQGFLERMFV